MRDIRPQCLIVAVLAGVFQFCPAASLADDLVSVEVKLAKIRVQPQLWANSLADAFYGDRLQLIEETNDWLKVGSKGVVGYIHRSAITKKMVLLTSSKALAKDIAFDPDEVTLAGKGFGRVAEEDFRGKTAKADYAALDLIESRPKVAPERLRQFLARGKLKMTGAS